MRGGGAFVLERKEVVWQMRCWDMSDDFGSFAGLPAACRLTAEKRLCGVIAGRSGKRLQQIDQHVDKTEQKSDQRAQADDGIELCFHRG